MCSVLVMTVIEGVLNDMVRDEKVFTVFDVTKEARNISTNNVPHRDVKKAVVNAFITGQMVNYNREVCTLNAADSPQAMVYFPAGKSATDHPKVESDEASVDDDEDIEDEVDTDDENVIKATKEGRVNIPKKILDKAELDGDSAFAFMVNGHMIYRKLTKEGTIRFSLAKLGFDGGKCRVTLNNSGIIFLEAV